MCSIWRRSPLLLASKLESLMSGNEKPLDKGAQTTTKYVHKYYMLKDFHPPSSDFSWFPVSFSDVSGSIKCYFCKSTTKSKRAHHTLAAIEYWQRRCRESVYQICSEVLESLCICSHSLVLVHFWHITFTGSLSRMLIVHFSSGPISMTFPITSFFTTIV